MPLLHESYRLWHELEAEAGEVRTRLAEVAAIGEDCCALPEEGWRQQAHEMLCTHQPILVSPPHRSC